MGKSLDSLPPSFTLPALAAFLLLLLIARRLFHHRAERGRTEREFLRYSNLHLLTTALSARGDLKQMVNRTLEGILQALEVAQGCALLHLSGPHGLNYSSARGFSSRALGRLAASPLDEYLSFCGERWGNLMVFPDLLRSELLAAQGRDPRFQEFWDVFTAEGSRTLVVAALETPQRCYGALVVASRKVRRFRSGELRLILGISRQISVALGNCSLQKTAERHDEELRILRRVGEALSATFDLERQLQILQRELKGLLGVANFALAFQESLEGRPETVFAFEGRAQAAQSRGAADGPAEYVLRTRAPLLITHDFINTTRRLGISPVDPTVRTWCGVPIHFSDGSVAVLTVADFEREGALDERRFHLLQILAGEAAVAIENARLFQREQRRARHLALLNEVGRKAAAVLDPQELLTNICRQLRTAFGYDLARVQTLDRERGGLVVEAQEGYGPTFLGHRCKFGEGLAGVAAESGEPVLANDVEQDERYIPLHPGVRSALSLPLIYRKETLGVLSVESLREHCFSPQDVLTLRTLADQLAIALHNARAYQVAQEQAITDSLTGLKTHRYFMEAMEAEWRRSPRSGRPFSLIMMDLDGFKQVNDRYGHLEGDKVLVAVARILEARSRQSNVVARYGGDEFALLLPEAGTEQAETLGERLCASFAADPYLASRSVTASLGIATFPVHGATPDEILRVADSGMYLAKHDQGNRVRVASNPSPSASADWEQQLLQAYLGVAVKRMFSTGPEVFNQYRARFEAATQDAEGQNVPLMDTVTALAFAIDAKDHYTKGHSQTVANLAAQIAQQVGLSGAELEEIRLAGILHDIGKIGIPESVLNKPARLTPEEFEVMKGHTALGDNILAPLKARAIERIRQLVRHHHERFDGGGYPDGLKGEEIPLGARILSIADCFDTLVSERAYKKPVPVLEATRELRRCRGSHFDATLVDAFLDSLAVLGDPRRRPVFEKTVN
jgi:diguanylate cyclase (GGDEF)-like protein/putative nucleotidyltransferase with HDIG domain